MPNSKTPEYTGKVIKKLLPDSGNGKYYKKANNPIQWVVIHNMGGKNQQGVYEGGTNSGSYSWWSKGAGGANTSAHYCVDDKEIWQTLEDNWKGHHTGTGKKGYYAADRGCNNNNSIGIEVADHNKVDKDKAIELTIELTRFLIKKYSLSIDNVVQHYDISGKNCPQWIRNNNKWDYIKREIKKRNDEQRPISFDSSQLQPGSMTPGGSIGGEGNVPNFDNREDLINLKEIRGLVLVHMPPYHFYSVKNKEEVWAKEHYSKEFHYLIDSTGINPEKNKSNIAMALQSNDRHTYIDRALYGNKSYKYTLSLGLFTSEMLEDYTVTEKKMIEEISKILYENGLSTNDLWREFDLNRAPSPFMYLDREQWKKLLREVDKQVEWRYENFGQPELPEKEPVDADNEILFNNIGKSGYTNRRCTLRKNPNMISDHIKVLEEGVPIKIIDYKKGYYQVEAGAEQVKGWIVYKSIKVNDENVPNTYSIKIRNKGIPQPEIKATMTHEEYLAWKSYTDPKIIDEFAARCEPYDKALPQILEAPVTDDDRLTALTKEQKTKNENTIYYSVTEGSPGGTDHCVRPTSELNALYKPDQFKVDPIYPDLIVPPNYATAENSIGVKNPIPLTALENNSLIKKGEDFDNNDLSFDFDLLKEMNKKSKGKPVNYLDPYPYDDKIYELENHSPKIKIDEIEARMYESNHPGDPMPQPVAKNFALVYDAMLNQSKKIESRMVRLENTLSFVLRSLGRIGSRVNVNCVYYGGQDTLGKYKTIRCLRDDRIHDACSVTLDQCLSCTRYEPIIGQIYEILDDTGMNGSVILDQMQMSYMSNDEFKSLNRVEERAVKHKYVNVNKDETEKPESMFKEWEEADKQAYIEKLKSTITDEEEYKKAIEALKREDYAFIMNWYEQDLDTQEPDVKAYPTEGIKQKYKRTDGEDSPSRENQAGLIDDTDSDYIEDQEKLDQLDKGEWVDTREKSDSYEENKYTTEDYYFEDFNKDIVYSADGSGIGGAFGAEARQKIVEMANIIVEEHNNLKAAYSRGIPEGNRTTDYTKPIYENQSRVNPNEKVKVYDCSSFVSCCYNHAGLKMVTNRNTTSMMEVFNMEGSKKWPATPDTIKDALPGDIIWQKGHTGVYIGDGKVAHSSGTNYPEGKDIYIIEPGKIFYTFDKSPVFARPKDLVEADAKANALSGNVIMKEGKITINGKEFTTLAEIKGAVCTPYNGGTFMGGGDDYSRTGQTYLDVVSGQKIKIPKESQGRNEMKYCASHNLPYGTQVYFPKLAEKGLGNGILMVVDTGGHVFDFDINLTNSGVNTFDGKQNLDAYVIKWGEDKVISQSFCKAARKYTPAEINRLQNGWRKYNSMGGKLIKFHKFNDEDKSANLNSPLSPVH